jgi:hypothetical protein
VSRLKRLKTFQAEFTQLKGITFGKKNSKLIKIKIWGDPKNYNKKIKSLNFSGVKNLKELRIQSLARLKSVKLGKKKKLKYMGISLCKKLKKINLKGCDFPKNAKISTDGRGYQ